MFRLRCGIRALLITLIALVSMEAYGDTNAFSYLIDHSSSETRQFAPSLNGGPPRPVGAMTDPGGNKDQFVLNEVIFAPRTKEELTGFLERYGGSIVRSGVPRIIDGLRLPPTYEPTSSGAYLIQVDLDRSDLSDFVANMQRAGFVGEFTFSSDAAARLVAILARERELSVDANFLMRGSDIMEHPLTAGGYLDAAGWPWMGEDDPNIPGEGELSVGVVRAWEYLAYLGVPPAASDGTSAVFTPVYVAIVDGGFALDEASGIPLNDNIDVFYSGTKPIQSDWVDNDGIAGGENRTSCTGGTACPWHGTGAFGVCCARPKNLYGTAGIGGPVTIPMFMRIDWTAYGLLESMYNLADAIRASTFFGLGLNRPDVISISISGYCFSVCKLSQALGREDIVDYMQRAVDTAVGFGAVVVASAGNEGWDLDNLDLIDFDPAIPCGLRHVICVGAISRSKSAMGYSNYGSDLDIWAPTDILSTVTPKSRDADILQLNNSTCDAPTGSADCDELYWFGGTSAAAPFISGVVALMIALDKNTAQGDVPTLYHADTVNEILRQTANPANSADPKVSRGYVDAYRAVAAVRSNQAPSIKFTRPSSGSSIRWSPIADFFSVEVNDPEPGTTLPIFVGDHKVKISSDRDGLLCDVRSSYRGQTTYLCSKPQMTLGQHIISAVVTDPFGAEGETKIVINVTNQPPTSEILAPNSGASFYSDQIIQFRGYAFDTDQPSQDLSLSWRSNIDGSLGSAENLLKTLSEGSHTVTLSAVDAFGVTGEDSIVINVQPGLGVPSAIIQPLTRGFFGPDELITFQGEGFDPEDGILAASALSWSSSRDGLLGTGTTLQTRLSGPPPTPCEASVEHLIQLQVTDSAGRRASQTVRVVVGRIC